MKVRVIGEQRLASSKWQMASSELQLANDFPWEAVLPHCRKFLCLTTVLSTSHSAPFCRLACILFEGIGVVELAQTCCKQQ
jgi:hypothetical protein